MSENLNLKSIGELLEYNFYIPSYQRGYRWEERQVLDLLEDILEFANKKDRGELNPKEFYCLQPIVVKSDKKLNKYKVIDGQQRLTTIYIILKYLEQARKYFDKKKTIYSLVYETRNQNENNSWSFLEKINNVIEVSTKNIDFFYMSNTYLTIKNWFEKEEVNEMDFLKILLKNDIKKENNIKIDYANNARVIWYEIDNNEDEIDAFTRLNIGKISLTSSELIKALFLLQKNKKQENEKIILASQWDNIEYKMQDNTFFAFIYGDMKEYKKPTRIEFIFDLIANNIDIKIDNLAKDNEKYSYYIFNKLLNDENYSYDERVTYLWDEVKTYFRIFEEFYNDNKYYHLVGFLVNNGKNINDILINFKNNSKDEFLSYLKDEISILIALPKDISFRKINYDDNSKLINKILFLFNVVSTMDSGYSKYPFDLHTKEEWSLEHIHAQNSENVKKDEDRKELLGSQLEYIKDESIYLKVTTLINSDKIDNEEFNKIQDEIFKLYSDDISIHTIDNMALLSQKDNSSLSNAIFPAKRDKIKQLDAKGSFIPIGTKNVFLKYYSSNVTDGVTWNKNDRKAYLKAMLSTLNRCKRAKND